MAHDDRPEQPDLPELLGLLAYELSRELTALLPARSTDLVNKLALALTRSAAARIGGHRMPVAPSVPASELADADAGYAALADVWFKLLERDMNMPQQWVRVAVLRLLDTARVVVGGQYVPKGVICQRRERDEALWDEFRGNYRETGIAHGISAERVRQVIGARLRAERAARQGRLFDDDC
ncbi:MAG: hypothetical protein KJZ96_15460 [Rhodocyclaceae bacterium]|nr:hypothetical protein [Rhodocyclaceae bacterium]